MIRSILLAFVCFLSIAPAIAQQQIHVHNSGGII